MKTEIIHKVKDSIEKMPPLSPVIHKIIQLTNDITSSAQQLTDVIQLDPVLMAKVTKTVNSAYFGLPQEVTSIKQAVVMLGINTLKNVALSTTIVDNIAIKKDTLLDGDAFWSHSFAVGVASKMIAARLGVDEKHLEEYFVSGLIHDIGKVLINNFFREEFEQVLSLLSKTNKPLHLLEKHVLGLNHQEIGIAIGKHWKFNNNYLYAVGRHHEPVKKGGAGIFSMIVSIANVYAKEMGYEDPSYFTDEIVDEETWASLGVSREDIYGSLENLDDEIKKARIFLQ